MTWLGSLPAWAIFPLFAAATLLLTVAVDGILRRRLVPDDVRTKASPTAATTLQALATIYAVLVAFVIVDEYGQLREAQSQVANKAAQLSVIYDNSRNLAPQSGALVRDATIRYARIEVRNGLPDPSPTLHSNASTESRPRSSRVRNRTRSSTSRSWWPSPRCHRPARI